jgi:hypothetical protein
MLLCLTVAPRVACSTRVVGCSMNGATTQPSTVPATVHVGLYEEFPNPWRLAKLEQVDFPVSLAVAAPTRDAFLKVRESIQRDYPQVRTVFFWPLLRAEEGYYPGPFSNPEAVRRVMLEATEVPVLWDLEVPPGMKHLSWPLRSIPQNRTATAAWLRARTQPVHIWRSYAFLGLNPWLLRAVGLHYDPLEYPAVSLHLDLYTTGTGQPEQGLQRLMREGVVTYGARFIPALGVLNDGEGSPAQFIPPETLRRNLRIARTAGVREVWLFGVNGLNAEYLQVVREELPLESMQP